MKNIDQKLAEVLRKYYYVYIADNGDSHGTGFASTTCDLATEAGIKSFAAYIERNRQVKNVEITFFKRLKEI